MTVRRGDAAAPLLGQRAIGRATLARQLLLERVEMGVTDVLEHLVGLQAQTPHTWYVGLWCRLASFRPEEAARLLEDRSVVRIALMRSTIHLVTARDCLAVRPLVGPVLERSMSGNFGKHLVGLDRAELAAAGRELLEQEPRMFSELGRALAEQWPDRDPASLAQAIRASEALVQVTPRGVWGRSGKAAHTTAESWLGRPQSHDLTVDDLVRRYLAAFGPASVKDAQVWSGLTRLAEVFDRLRPDLMTFRDEAGRELFDLPDAPRPDADTPAPVRLLYDYDNLLLSHDDRSRVVTDAYRQASFDINGPMPRLVLVDGLTGGTWTSAVEGDTATVTLRPFGRWSKKVTTEVTAEAAALAGFLAPEATYEDVRVVAPT